MLKRKYMLILGGLLVFACFIAGILSVTINYMQSGRQWALRELKEQVNAGSKQLQFYVKGMSSHLIRIEKYLANKNMKVDKELYNYLDFARNYNPNAISEILILDADGNGVAGTNPSSLKSSFRKSEYFKNTQHTFNKIFLSETIIVSDLNIQPEVASKIFHDPLDLGWVLYTGVYSKGVFKGVVLFVLRSEPFFNRYSMALSKLTSGYGFILQEDGRILFHRDVELRGKFLSDLPDSSDMARAKDLLKKTEEKGFGHRVIGQHIMLASEIYLPNQIWTAGISTTKSKLAQKTITFIYTLSGLVLLLGTIIFGLVFALIRLGQARHDLMESEEKLRIRNQIAGIFLTVTDEEMYGAVLDIVLDLLESKYGVFGYIDDNGALVCLSMTKDIWDRCQMIDKDVIFPEDTWGDSIWGNGLRTKKSAYSNKPFKVPEGHIPVVRCLTVPLVFQNKSMGIFTVANKSTDYTDSDKQILEAIAEYVAPVLNAKIERMRAEESLRESEAHKRAILDTSVDMVIQYDKDLRIIWANKTAAAIVNKNPEDLVGHKCYEYFHHADAPCPGCPCVTALKTSNIENAIIHHPAMKSVSESYWDNFAVPLKDESGRIVSIIEIARNITKQKKMEIKLRQQQKIESIGTLAGGVAHEINNPINGIMNYAQLIVDRLDTDNPLSEFAGEIIHETERVAAIVRNLLTFARQEKQTHSPARMADIVEQTLSLILTVFRSDQITLEANVPDDLPKIKCRSQQIRQVIMNLMTNARDALNERYPEYDPDKKLSIISQMFEEDEQKWIRTTVEDHGSGIDPDIQERMFDPFFTTKPRETGTGLGLSISYGIVQDHHGKLHVETEPGQYTRFHLDLPVDNGWELE